MAWLGGLFSVIASGISGFFGFKREQGEVVKQAIGFLGDTSRSDDARASAAAVIIAAEANSDSWITRAWRPLTVTLFVIMLFAFFFGFTAPNVTPGIIDRVFDIVEGSIFGYMGLSSLDKMIKNLSLGSVLKNFIQKKLG